MTYRKKCSLTAIVCLIFVWACSSLPSAQTQGQEDSHVMSHVHVPGHNHDYPETFSNPPGSVERNFSWESLWFFPSRPFAQLFDQEVPEGFVIESDDAKAQFEDAEGKNSVTWIGHMSTVIRLDGRVILLDPWFTDYASPLPPFGPHRKMPPGLSLEQLPPIDLVVVSHNHYDHFDLPTLESLPNPENITLIMPLRMGAYVEHIPFKEVIELAWDETVVRVGIEVTALPVVHFSARGLFDRNETLWAGFALKGQRSGGSLFHFEGDYGNTYRRIGQEHGPFDIALIAVGAYKPRDIMVGAHCALDDCVQAGIDLKADILIPVHWGTTVLGTEDIYETGQEFREEALAKGIPDERIWLMKIGETRIF